MKKKVQKKKSKQKVVRRMPGRVKLKKVSSGDAFKLSQEIDRLHKAFEKMTSSYAKSEDHAQDLEIHLNLLTRLLTTLCVEKFGMRIGVLKRIIKRIEREAIRDSQIDHLESLYKLSSTIGKKRQAPYSSPHDDPWDDIS